MRVLNAQGQTLLKQVKWCDSFGSKLRGLMFRRSIAAGEGLMLVEEHAGIAATAIHMFFVPFDIAALWLDDDLRIVHKTLAKAWRPYYASPRPARYVLEGPPQLLQQVAIGEQLHVEE